MNKMFFCSFGLIYDICCAQCVLFLSFSPLREEDINAMEMEDDKRDLISREISKFRDTHKVTYQTAVVTL